MVFYNSSRRGMAVDTLAKKFQRNRSSMYRVLSEIRAQRLVDLDIECIYHESFDDPTQAAHIVASMPESEAFEVHPRHMRLPKDAPPEPISNYEMPLLTKDQEPHHFRTVNLLERRP